MNDAAKLTDQRRGVMLVLSSPSGAGKTTLARRLLESEPELRLSVSVTTRRPRPGERNGIDYIFINHDEFRRQVEGGELLEWAEVFGNRYGTPGSPVERLLATGHDVLFDIDWQGARQLRQRMPRDIASVFILPPSGETLRQRLMARAQDSAEVIARRMAQASTEISHWGEYDYVIVNSDIDESASKLTTILAAERLRRARRQPHLTALVATITAEL